MNSLLHLQLHRASGGRKPSTGGGCSNSPTLSSLAVTGTSPLISSLDTTLDFIALLSGGYALGLGQGKWGMLGHSIHLAGKDRNPKYVSNWIQRCTQNLSFLCIHFYPLDLCSLSLL